MKQAIIRIILADDHPLILESWKILLENNPGLKVVAECNNGRQAIDLSRQLLPDILLLDVHMPPPNGFDVALTVSKEIPSVRIIGLSVHNHPRIVRRMMESGARGYLTKTSPLEEIHFGIDEVCRGAVYICREVMDKLSPEQVRRFQDKG